MPANHELQPQLTQIDLNHLFEVMPSGLIFLDQRGFVSHANPLAKRLLGEPLEGMRWLELIPTRFAPKADDGHELSLTNGKRVQLQISPLKDSRGQLIVITDMTQTRALQAHVAKLERVSALGNMVASLAHQIRTPLSAAMLYAANLGNATLNAAARTRFQNKLSARLNDLEKQVNDMLLFVRSDGEMRMSEVLASELASALFDSVEILARNKSISLVHNELLDKAVLWANDNALVSALSNLVSNAIEASAQGGHVRLDWQCDEANVYFSVEDEAGGIEAHLLSRIFDAFFTNKENGTGLGLAIVKQVVQAHKGHIRVENTAKGARFVVSLPRTGE